MEKVKQRIDQLDGLRGIAIILVILNHMRLEPLYAAIPQSLHLYVGLLTGSGKIGVATLFLLSGYLMASIYPTVTSKRSFWQKRYTRIFPGFVAMSTALIFIRYYWKYLPLALIPVIVIGCLWVGGLIWKKIQASPNRTSLGKKIFFGFIFFQLATAIGYIFVFPHLVPPAIFFQVWPKWQQSIFTYLVNMTMTIPFGTYVGQLDGVYWSVITEVLFYLTYPVVFLPLLQQIKQKKSVALNIAVVVLLFPFFYGMYLLFKEVLGLYMLNIHFGIYLTLGMIIAECKEFPLFVETRKVFAQLPRLLLIFIPFVLLVGSSLFASATGLDFYASTLLWAVPVSCVFFLSLDSTNAWSQFLSHKWLVLVGKVSYALYLTHTIALEMFVRAGDPQDVPQMIWILLQSIITMAILTYFLHTFLEVPYFNKDKKEVFKESISNILVKIKNLFSPKIHRFATAGVVSLFTLFLVWYAFRIPVPLTAHVVNHRQDSTPYKTIILQDPVQFTFTSQYQNLGMILVHLSPLSKEEMVKNNLGIGESSQSTLDIRVSKDPDTQLIESKYPLYQLFESRFHPVGLPLEANSKGENITLSLRASESPQSYISLINEGIVFRSVYFLNKKELLSHPSELVKLVVEKVTQPFLEYGAKEVLLFSAPLLVLILGSELKTSFSKSKK